MAVCDELMAVIETVTDRVKRDQLRQLARELCDRVESVGNWMTYDASKGLGACGAGKTPCYAGFEEAA